MDPFGLCKDSAWSRFWKKVGETIYTFFNVAVSVIFGPHAGVAMDPNFPEAAEAVPHIVWESRIREKVYNGEITYEEYYELHNLHSNNQWGELKQRYQEIMQKD